MQALVLENKKLLIRRDYPRPEPGKGEVLIRPALVGVCSTDLEIVKGYGEIAGVLGHEFVGVVAEVGPETDPAWLGKRVVGSISIGCGQCEYCQSHGPGHCPQRQTLGIRGRDGVFAEYFTLPAQNLHEVPDGLADEMAVFTEPLAAAVHIREQIKDVVDGRIAVVGPGRLGLLIGLVMSLVYADVYMLGRRLQSLSLPSALGMKTGLVADQPADSFDLVIEATGNEAGLAHSMRLVKPLGTMVLKSTFVGATTIDLTKLVVSEINIVGSRCGPFEPALDLLAQGAIPTELLIDGRYPLAQGLEAFHNAARPGIRKILLEP